MLPASATTRATGLRPRLPRRLTACLPLGPSAPALGCEHRASRRRNGCPTNHHAEKKGRPETCLQAISWQWSASGQQWKRKAFAILAFVRSFTCRFLPGRQTVRSLHPLGPVKVASIAISASRSYRLPSRQLGPQNCYGSSNIRVPELFFGEQKRELLWSARRRWHHQAMTIERKRTMERVRWRKLLGDPLAAMGDGSNESASTDDGRSEEHKMFRSSLEKWRSNNRLTSPFRLALPRLLRLTAPISAGCIDGKQKPERVERTGTSATFRGERPVNHYRVERKCGVISAPNDVDSFASGGRFRFRLRRCQNAKESLLPYHNHERNEMRARGWVCRC